MINALATVNVFNWLGIYQPALTKLHSFGLKLERLDLSGKCEDPVPHRIHVSYESVELDRTVAGYAEGKSEVSAYEKAFCEMFEREAVFKHGAALGLTSTNGIAAHRLVPLAKHAAKRELFERDAFLRHWLTRTPLVKIRMPPDKMINAFAKELNASGYDLILCETYLGFISTSIAIVVDRRTGGFRLGSSAALTRLARHRKAVGEVFVGIFADRDMSIDPDYSEFKDHSNHWFLRETMPTWLVGTEPVQLARPPLPKVTYHLLSSDPVPVVAAVCNQALPLWLGKTPAAIIDTCSRLYGVPINTDLHPFP